MGKDKNTGLLEGIENLEEEISPYPSNKPEAEEIDEEFDAELAPELDDEASLQKAVSKLGQCYTDFCYAMNQITKSHGSAVKVVILDSILLTGQDQKTNERIRAKIGEVKTAYDKYNKLVEKLKSSSNTITQEQIVELREALNGVFLPMSELNEAVKQLKTKGARNSLRWAHLATVLIPENSTEYIKYKIQKITGYSYKNKDADCIKCIYLNKDNQLVSAEELTNDERTQITKDHGFDPKKHDLSTDVGGIYVLKLSLLSLFKDIVLEKEKIAEVTSQVEQAKIDMQEEDIFYDAEEDIFYDAAQTPEEMKRLYGTDEKRYAEDTGMPQQVQDEVASKLNRISKLFKTLRQKMGTIWETIQNLIKLDKGNPKETREEQEKRDEGIKISRIMLREELGSTHTDGGQALDPSEAGHGHEHGEHGGDHTKHGEHGHEHGEHGGDHTKHGEHGHEHGEHGGDHTKHGEHGHEHGEHGGDHTKHGEHGHEHGEHGGDHTKHGEHGHEHGEHGGDHTKHGEHGHEHGEHGGDHTKHGEHGHEHGEHGGDHTKHGEHGHEHGEHGGDHTKHGKHGHEHGEHGGDHTKHGEHGHEHGEHGGDHTKHGEHGHEHGEHGGDHTKHGEHGHEHGEHGGDHTKHGGDQKDNKLPYSARLRQERENHKQPKGLP